MTQKPRYQVFAKAATWDDDRESSWLPVSDMTTDYEEALADWTRQDEINGHNTYHRLVRIEILREA
jgi:hypothetical protein